MAADLNNSSVYSETDSSNNTATDPGWPEGMAPSRVNDAARALQGALKRDWDRRGPTVTSGGTANAQTLTYTVAPTAYVQGDTYAFIAGATNTGAATLNVNALGAKNIFVANAAMTGGEIISGQVYVVVYDGTRFQLVSPQGTQRGALIGVQKFTASGTSTYTPTAGTASVVVEVWGSGGGGGGVALTGVGQCALGQGGGGGGYAIKRITSSFSGVTVTVGAKGTGGTAGANNGTAGNTSSFGALVSATGGSGGTGGAAAAPPFVTGATVAGGAGSSGDLNLTGGTGGGGMTGNATNGVSGAGGTAARGGAGGGQKGAASGAGNAGTQPGGGGGGALNQQSSAAVAGGDGGDGAVIVWEYN